MNDIVKSCINASFIRELGMTYDEFNNLDFNSQQRIIESRRKAKNKSNKVRVMIGSGEHAIFVTKKRGERYLLSDGTFAVAGDSPEQSRKRVDSKLKSKSLLLKNIFKNYKSSH